MCRFHLSIVIFQEYLLFHYGGVALNMPYEFGPKEAANFPSRTASVAHKFALRSAFPTRALDVGCAVGGASFELAKEFDEVVGIDFSSAFIDAARELQSEGQKPYTAMKQASNTSSHVASVDPEVDRSRVTFMQGDACNLELLDIGKFDVIHASNLLCRLPNPRKFLADAPSLLRPGGRLVLVSPYSWLDEYTESSEWIGGQDGHDSFEALKMVLAPSFTLEHREDSPFLIREHERKFQYGVSDCTVWALK